MSQLSNQDLERLYRRFEASPSAVEIRPFGSGHINSTYLVRLLDGSEARYVLQRISSAAFHDPDAVMENIRRVTEHLRRRDPSPDSSLRFCTAADGSACLHDESGAWRLYRFVDGLCLDKAESPQDFYECGYGFGAFQRDLADFPAAELHETIPDFHNTPKRLSALKKAADDDVCRRLDGVRAELAFALAREPFTHILTDAHAAGRLPLRVTHNDTKLNNVLLDKTTRKALCVIDLDTVMSGFSVTDFGDAIRFGANTAAEDEPELSKVRLDLTLFRAFTEGYLAGCDRCLTETELSLLPEGAKMMTLECGIRFLTDYLCGDTYFHITLPGQNLLRCRTQFRLVEEMEAHWEEMKDIVRDCAGSRG